MKKWSTWILSIFSLLIFVIVGYDVIASYNIPRDIELHGNHKIFNYSELVNESDVVALIEVQDSLSSKNSTVVYQDNSPFIKYHYATREARVLEYYKNELDLGLNIKFNEPAAITNNKEYLHGEGYNTFKKGDKYIVYLSTNNGLGELSLISRNNGKINLKDFSSNEFKDIAIQTVLQADGIKLSIIK